MPKITLILLLSVCLWGCSSQRSNIPSSIRKLKNLHAYSSDAQPAYHIAFKKDATYGSTKNVIVGAINALAVSDSGRVFLGNPARGLFFVYKPDGRFLTKLGGKGKGPGEFSYFIHPTVMDDDLYVYDLSQRRISIFSMDSLALVRTINLKVVNQATIKALRGYGLHYVYPWAHGNFLAEFTPNDIRSMKLDSLRQKYFLINAKGKVISHLIFEQKGRGVGLLMAHYDGRTHGGSFKFIPHSLIAIASNHHIFAGWSSRFLIKEYNSDGKYLRAFYYPFKKVSLTRKQAMQRQKNREYAKHYQKVLQHNDIPHTWPALHSMRMDSQNRLWISTIVKNMHAYQWWILNKKGKIIARFTWPRKKPIEEIKNGYVYTKETNAKTGVQRIVRYKIQMQ